MHLPRLLPPSGLLAAGLALGAAPPASPFHVQDPAPEEEPGPKEEDDEKEENEEERDEHVVLLRAERVIVRPGQVVEDGRVLVVDGRIEEVGPDVTAPEGAEVVEGQVVCAGFLDPWSGLGVESAAVRDGRAEPHTRTVDALDPYGSEPAREEARAAGVLAVRVQAGRPANLGGYGAWISTGPGSDPAELVLLEDANMGAMIGLEERGTADPFDRISMADKVADEVRSGLDYRYEWVEYERELAEWKAAIEEKEKELEKDFKKAKRKREKEMEEAKEEGKEFEEERYKEDKPPRRPRYDAEDEAMARVADGEIPLVVECHRASELRALLARTREFDRLRLVIAGGTEAPTVAEELARRRIPVIVHPAPLGSGRPDHLSEHALTLAAQLEEADVPVLLGSGGGAAARDLPSLAALAIGHGLDPEEAFAALTYRAARALDVADRLGSVQYGRRGDLLVLDGEPFALATRITHVLVDGRVVVSPEEDD